MLEHMSIKVLSFFSTWLWKVNLSTYSLLIFVAALSADEVSCLIERGTVLISWLWVWVRDSAGCLIASPSFSVQSMFCQLSVKQSPQSNTFFHKCGVSRIRSYSWRFNNHIVTVLDYLKWHLVEWSGEYVYFSAELDLQLSVFLFSCWCRILIFLSFQHLTMTVWSGIFLSFQMEPYTFWQKGVI